MRDRDPLSDLIQSIEDNLQGGGWEPVDNNGAPREPANLRRYLWYLLPFLLIIFFNRILSFYTDWIWYDSIDLLSVFYTRIYASFGLMIAGGVAFWLFLAVNVLIARRIEPFGLRNTSIEEAATALKIRVVPVVLLIGAVLAFFIGVGLSSAWEEVLVYLNQSNFELMDPVFQRDVSFYIFTLPVWQLLHNWLMSTVIITLIATALLSGVGWQGWDISRPVRIHLSVLGAFVLLLVAWQYRLDAYNLVYSQRGAVFGAGYTDVNAQLPAFNLLALLTLVAAVLLIVMAFLPRAWRAMAAVLVVWVGASFIAGNVYPGLIQRFQVNPNELNLEREFIEDNIEFTRAAYQLDEVEVEDYNAENPLTVEAITNEPGSILNVRLWDYRPLLQTYNQIQALRQYYVFNDIDIDRYTIDGEVRQVMLAARELVPDQLDENAQTWVNRRLVYTHGYGVAASPVAQITRDGLPEFLIQDLPPQGVIPVTRPQIYFGELTNDYVIVNTNEPEFDYPRENGNVFTSFEGDTGIPMSFLNRLVFALRFADINILLNSDISAESQLLWRRNLRNRIAAEIAPFLAYDSDPYIVVGDDGGLYWFLDAYTISDRFPYSEPSASGNFNYIRNPVKVVTNAYDGTMHFYMIDEEPIAATYARIFPDLFTSVDEMPEDLLAHIRYPNDLFSVQADVFRTYHMTDANEFYNKEDLWAWPQELLEGESQRIEPYYVLMELPNSDELDFIQILPFTPVGRENMLAWLAGQNDPDRYGEKVVYQFGKDSLIYGPKQIEARIDQDPVISSQLSLWNQQGSNVIRGNLLVIPIDDSLLYVEPLYLQAASGRIPELKRVILATADRVVMAENLGLALIQLLGEEIQEAEQLAELFTSDVTLTAAAGGAAPDAASLGTASVEELVLLANSHYVAAQDRLSEGDWAGYGLEMNTLQTVLEQLAASTGIDLPMLDSESITGTETITGADPAVAAPEDAAPADAAAEDTGS